MEPIQLNRSQILHSTLNERPETEVELESSSQTSPPATIVTVSPEGRRLATAETTLPVARFLSDEERGENTSKILSKMITYEQFEKGTYAYETEEDFRLSQLSMKELLTEAYNATKLPDNDFGVLAISTPDGTEQGDRYRLAKANLFAEEAFQVRKSSEQVASSIEAFKTKIEDLAPQIDKNSYDIIYQDGKVVAIGIGTNAASKESLATVQAILDEPNDDSTVKTLLNDIEVFNNTVLHQLETAIIADIGAMGQHSYLPETVPIEELFEGFSYTRDINNQGFAEQKLYNLQVAASKLANAEKASGTYPYQPSPGQDSNNRD